MLCRVFTNAGVDVGLVGCVMSLRIDSKEAEKEFNLMFPGSSDVIGGTGIGMFSLVVHSCCPQQINIGII